MVDKIVAVLSMIILSSCADIDPEVSFLSELDDISVQSQELEVDVTEAVMDRLQITDKNELQTFLNAMKFENGVEEFAKTQNGVVTVTKQLALETPDFSSSYIEARVLSISLIVRDDVANIQSALIIKNRM